MINRIDGKPAPTAGQASAHTAAVARAREPVLALSALETASSSAQRPVAPA